MLNILSFIKNPSLQDNADLTPSPSLQSRYNDNYAY